MFYGGEWVIVSFLGSFFWGGVQAGFFRLGTAAVIYGLAHPLRVCTRLVRNGPTGQYGVSNRFGFSMRDGRETVLPSAGRCCL